MFGEFIAAARAARGRTREELARRAGFVTAMVAALERGETVWATPHVIAGLAAALGLPAEALARAAHPPDAQ